MSASSGRAAINRRSAKAIGSALLLYRIMAFTTGVVLVAGCLGLILQWADVVSQSYIGWLWVAHGYLYLVYLVATANLALKLRWQFVRFVLVALAGTIPTMSFVAEHYVTRDARAGLAADGPNP